MGPVGVAEYEAWAYSDTSFQKRLHTLGGSVMIPGQLIKLSTLLKLIVLSFLWALVVLKLAAVGAPGTVASYPLNHDLGYPLVYTFRH